MAYRLGRGIVSFTTNNGVESLNKVLKHKVLNGHSGLAIPNLLRLLTGVLGDHEASRVHLKEVGSAFPMCEAHPAMQDWEWLKAYPPHVIQRCLRNSHCARSEQAQVQGGGTPREWSWKVCNPCTVMCTPHSGSTYTISFQGTARVHGESMCEEGTLPLPSPSHLVLLTILVTPSFSPSL